MIIKYPTGLYSSILPKGLQRGDVTFTISSQPPPRTNSIFPKLPPGVAGRRRPPDQIPQQVRRTQLGELIYSVNQSSSGGLGSGMQQYEVGQILQFGPVPSQKLEPLLAGTASDIQHNTGLLDYQLLGWDQQVQQQVQQQADERYQQLQLELDQARVNYTQLQLTIVENQKQLNEASKALAALQLLQGVDQLIGQLRERIQQLQQERALAVVQANEASQLASQLQSDIRALAQVVR